MREHFTFRGGGGGGGDNASGGGGGGGGGVGMHIGKYMDADINTERTRTLLVEH